jgi:hypothetical protein
MPCPRCWKGQFVEQKDNGVDWPRNYWDCGTVTDVMQHILHIGEQCKRNKPIQKPRPKAGNNPRRVNCWWTKD